MKKRWLIVFLFFLFISLYLQLVIAEHQVSPTSFSVGINQDSLFTVTITNTDPEVADSGINPNITSVEITLPSGVVFRAGTGLTNTLGTFSEIGGVLTWINPDWLIGNPTGGDNSKTFSFNANSTSLGKFNISVETTNSTGTFQKNVALTVSDIINPEVTLVNPDYDEDIDGILVFECNATDNFRLSTIILYIYSNNSEIYRNTTGISGTNTQINWDYTFDADGNYKWNCFVNDSSGNWNWAQNRTIKISAGLGLCTPNWDCDDTDWSECIDDLQTRTCNDLNSCNNNLTKPDESQSCVSECVPDWDCTGWIPTECPKNKTQTRTCTDSNNCDDTTNKPSETKACTYEGTGSVWIFVTIIVILLIGGVALALVFYFRSKKRQENSYKTPPAYGNYGNTQNQGYT